MEISQRDQSLLSALEDVARRVHSLDGYPPYMPDDDFAGFLNSNESIGAWVATVRQRPIGQVALHTGSSAEVMALACNSLGVSADTIAVVARLVVDPDYRRTGVAARLLDVAASSASDRGLLPILDVVDQFRPAIALYEREGWTRLGTVTVQLPDGTSISERVYTAPSN